MKHTQSSLKIGIVLSSIPGYSETFFRNKIKGLQSNGLDVTLYVDTFSEVPQNLSCKVVSAPSLGNGFISKTIASCVAAVKCICLHPKRSLKHYNLDKADGLPFKHRIKNLLLNQYLLNQNLDWLHFGYGMLANSRENVAEAIGCKMAVSFRGFDLYLSPLKHKNCYKVLFSKKVKYHVLSEKMKHTLIANHISEQRIHVITPAIDINLFASGDYTTKAKENLEILCISRLHWVKGLNYVLEALAILKSDNIDFKFTIIGDGEERERLVFAAYQLGILEDVTFAGKLSQTEVLKALKQSNLYIQYSIQEGFGNAALEAQALGLPCVVSDADGLQQNVLHEKTGLVVPKRNPKALARAILELHSLDSEKKQHMADFAIQRVRNEFNIEKQTALFLEFYSN
ncbi:glycosyltransferase family 4 protein [Psychroserpens algicola]|uniref:Glycosyltransferase family 4 protein n=1 Tax=Psychroserpens algicola TaxID=1719034 RepID=A0ABT0H5B1_9FLAO|nr:glycosyltransferase family 4 protein [Psychroserpens algicola]MCK8479556.1 glycosyltransferase family 4 protein [Psychroserpens algicola]